jgi:hypothetical protein
MSNDLEGRDCAVPGSASSICVTSRFCCGGTVRRLTTTLSEQEGNHARQLEGPSAGGVDVRACRLRQRWQSICFASVFPGRRADAHGHWIHEGVLDFDPATISLEKFSLRYRTEG